jgi:hypothetical protein
MKPVVLTCFVYAFASAASLEAGPSSEVVIQALSATPIPSAKPSPLPTLHPQPKEILVQPASPPPQSTSSIPGLGDATLPHAAEITDRSDEKSRQGEQVSVKSETADTDEMIPKEKVIALVKRIQQQQREIEENQININIQIYNITQVTHQAFMFSRRASK